MKLKFKEQKIRDLFIYHTNVIPIDIQVTRHSLIIKVKDEDVEASEKILPLMEKILGRRVYLDIEKEFALPYKDK